MAAFSLASRRKYWPWLSDISCTDYDSDTHNASIHGDPAHRASVHRLAGDWPTEKAAGSLTLDFDARHRRRFRLTGDQGEDVLLDLPQAVAMADGDGLHLEDGRWLKVRAAAELLVEV